MAQKLFENVFDALTLWPLHLNQSIIELTLEIRFQAVNRFPPFFGVTWLKTAIQYNVFQPLFLPLRTSVMVSFYKLWPIAPNVPKCVRSQEQQEGVYCLCKHPMCAHFKPSYSLCVQCLTVSVFSNPAPLLQSYCGRVTGLIPED